MKLKIRCTNGLRGPDNSGFVMNLAGSKEQVLEKLDAARKAIEMMPDKSTGRNVVTVVSPCTDCPHTEASDEWCADNCTNEDIIATRRTLAGWSKTPLRKD